MGRTLIVAVLAVAVFWMVWSGETARAQTPAAVPPSVGAAVPITTTELLTTTQALTSTGALTETWFSLTDEGGAFSLQFPAAWTAAQSELGAILLQGPSHELAYVSVYTLPITQTEEAAVDRWIEGVKPAWTQMGEQVTADQRGRWDLGITGAFARVTAAGTEASMEQLFIVSRRPDGRVVGATSARAGSSLTEDDLSRLEHILASLQLSPGADRPLAAPVNFLKQRQSGAGPQGRVPLRLLERQATFQLTFDGRSSFVVWLLDDQGQRVDLLVNQAGPLNRIYSLAIPRTGDYALQVAGSGSWEITVSQ